MPDNTGLITIIISASFGGLISAIVTQYFFEERERRRILLEKYEETIRSIQDTQTRLKDYYGFLDTQLTELNYKSLSDISYSEIQKLERTFRKDYFRLLDQVSLIHLVGYYDNHFEIVASNYYSKAWEFIDEVSMILYSICKRDYPRKENFHSLYQELDIVASMFIIELQHSIKKLMQSQTWHGEWQPPK
jgi:hypothetical protein